IASRDDKPSTIAFEQLAKALYHVHPYRLSMGGERASVERLEPQALGAYHARHLQPSKMVLTVVGDIDAEEGLAHAEAAFGQVPGAGEPAIAVPVEPPWSGAREVKRELKKQQTHLVLGFPGARVTEPWRRALEVLSTMLSGQSGRLFLELRDR